MESNNGTAGFRKSKGEQKMEVTEMDKKEIKVVIEWCDEKGHSEHEILDLIRRIVNANPRESDNTDE